jgi:hypothetical protein
MLAFITRDLAGWIGVPVVLVIAAMMVLRRVGKQLRVRRQQAHDDRPPAAP